MKQVAIGHKDGDPEAISEEKHQAGADVAQKMFDEIEQRALTSEANPVIVAFTLWRLLSAQFLKDGTSPQLLVNEIFEAQPDCSIGFMGGQRGKDKSNTEQAAIAMALAHSMMQQMQRRAEENGISSKLFDTMVWDGLAEEMLVNGVSKKDLVHHLSDIVDRLKRAKSEPKN